MRLYQFSALLLGVLLLTACGQKSAGLQDSVVPPDEVLYENGMSFFERGQYTRARLAFQTLINTYPDSDYTPASFLAIANSYYREGGTENLLHSEAQYKDFIIFYPTHEMADDAQLRIAAINYRLMKPHDRDPTYGRKAETELIKFLNDYADSEYAPTAREFLQEVQDTLAMHTFDIGNYYFMQTRNYSASESRFKEVLEKYPDFRHQDVNLFRLAESLERSGRIEEASVYYARLAAEYPFSSHFERARDRLILLEKEVPPVDQMAAARNQANQRADESFSLFDPIRSVIEIFTGGEDPYEIAKRRAEQRRSQNHDGASGGGAEGQK